MPKADLCRGRLRSCGENRVGRKQPAQNKPTHAKEKSPDERSHIRKYRVRAKGFFQNVHINPRNPSTPLMLGFRTDPSMRALDR